MGIRNSPEKQREYNRAAEERRRKAGYRRHTIIAHDDDWPVIRRLADELRATRSGDRHAL